MIGQCVSDGVLKCSLSTSIMATTEGLSGRGTILRTSLKPLYLTGMVYRLDPFLVLWT